MGSVKEKIENSKMIKDKIDTWISNCDSKVSFILTFLGVVVTIIFTSDIGEKMFKTLSFSEEKICCGNSFLQYLEFACFLLFVGFVIRSFYFSYFTLVARIDTNTYKETGLITDSNLFFMTITDKDFSTYQTGLENLSDEKFFEDLNSQIYINSKIAKEKFQNYNKSLKSTMYSLLIFSFVLIISSF